MDISKTKLGYFKVSTCIPKLWIGDVFKNTKEHIRLISESPKDSRVIIFPELSLTGYTCGELFFSEDLKKNVERGIDSILGATKDDERLVILGAPWEG